MNFTGAEFATLVLMASNMVVAYTFSGAFLLMHCLTPWNGLRGFCCVGSGFLSGTEAPLSSELGRTNTISAGNDGSICCNTRTVDGCGWPMAIADPRFRAI